MIGQMARGRMTESSDTPAGVIGIALYPNGHELASVSDFNLSGYGGFTLHESQEQRVKDKLAREVIRAMCADAVYEVIENCDCRKIWNALVRKGYICKYIRVGEDRKRVTPDCR